MSLLSGAAIGDAIADEISLPTATVRTSVSMSKDPILGLWKLFGAVGLYLASERVDKVHWKWIGTGGRGAAIVLGVSGIADLLRVNQKEEGV
jgi:hypothetical protein